MEFKKIGTIYAVAEIIDDKLRLADYGDTFAVTLHKATAVKVMNSLQQHQQNKAFKIVELYWLTIGGDDCPLLITPEKFDWYQSGNEDLIEDYEDDEYYDINIDYYDINVLSFTTAVHYAIAYWGYVDKPDVQGILNDDFNALADDFEDWIDKVRNSDDETEYLQAIKSISNSNFKDNLDYLISKANQLSKSLI